MTVNADDHLLCDECHGFFELNSDQTQCISCGLASDGCRSCFLDDFDTPTECLECAENLNLQDGECFWDEC